MYPRLLAHILHINTYTYRTHVYLQIHVYVEREWHASVAVNLNSAMCATNDYVFPVVIEYSVRAEAYATTSENKYDLFLK